MTTATQNEQTTVTETEVTEVISSVTFDDWKGQHVNHSLNDRARSIAATIEPLVKDTTKGIQWTKKDYYTAGERHGYSAEALKDVEQFNADFVSAVHAVSADKCLARLTGDKDLEEFTVKAQIGENSTYKDNYRRFNSRQIRNPQTGETSVQETYGYHNPSVTTEVKGFNESRQSVHSLAKELLG